MADACETCRFFSAAKTDVGEPIGECRRRSPGHYEQDMPVFGELATLCSRWPVIKPDDFCGEYQPNEATIAAAEALVQRMKESRRRHFLSEPEPTDG